MVSRMHLMKFYIFEILNCADNRLCDHLLQSSKIVNFQNVRSRYSWLEISRYERYYFIVLYEYSLSKDFVLLFAWFLLIFYTISISHGVRSRKYRIWLYRHFLLLFSVLLLYRFLLSLLKVLGCKIALILLMSVSTFPHFFWDFDENFFNCQRFDSPNWMQIQLTRMLEKQWCVIFYWEVGHIISWILPKIDCLPLVKTIRTKL